MSRDDRLHIFGIRHHGPGSAIALERALAAVDPAVVLIEGPPEADAVLPHASSAGMRPPVAILVYARDEPGLSAFYPFAEYSPEWRALLWAQRCSRPVRFIDLPAAWRLSAMKAERDAAKAAAEKGEETSQEEETTAPSDTTEDAPAPNTEPNPVRVDPIGVLAAAAGYEDGEAWWSALIEETASGLSVFASIEAAMAVLREDAPPEVEHEQRREAYMRVEIARALGETEGSVAVVVGAWHAPAVRKKAKVADDRALLKGAPRLPTEACWAPWTEPRLAALSGYRAGVVSPAWYGHVWAGFADNAQTIDPRRRAAGWLGRAARLMRNEGLPASTASVIEAVRLAEALAALRGAAAPGLSEMRDAALAALTHGERAPWRLIERKLVIGDGVGQVDEAAPQPPLQQDLARQQKKLRLEQSADGVEVSLDLRSNAGLAKSQLLHRLIAIDVGWARPLDPGGSRGTFRERWSLVWTPELSVKLAEASIWGATIEAAAAERVSELASAEDAPAKLAGLVERALMAGLDAAARAALARLQAAAAATSDTSQILATLMPLAETVRYGVARELPRAEIEALFAQLLEAAAIGLPIAARALDAAASAAFREALLGADRAAALAADEARLADWRAAVGETARSELTAPLVAGCAARLLYDAGALAPVDAGLALSRALSPSRPPGGAAAWLEGFLAGDGEALMHDAALLGALDAWIAGLAEDGFTAALPMLRRGFSGLDAMQRRRMLEAALAARGGSAEAAPVDDADPPGWAEALPLLKTMLGLPP